MLWVLQQGNLPTTVLPAPVAGEANGPSIAQYQKRHNTNYGKTGKGKKKSREQLSSGALWN
jgi:hypothetical protein